MGLGVRPTQALLHPAQPSLRTGRSRHPGHGRRPVLGLPCPCGPPHNTRTLGAPVLRPPLAPRVDAHCSASH